MPLTDVLGEEGRKALNGCVKVSIYGPPVKRFYSKETATKRLKRCNPGTGVDWELEISHLLEKNFAGKNAFDVIEIHNVLELLDKRFMKEKLQSASRSQSYPEVSKQAREDIKLEYSIVSVNKLIEIQHGSGFFVHKHFVITCEHVIDTAVNSKSPVINISNDAIGELPCEIVHVDVAKDLALLHCQTAGTSNGIRPLQLSGNVELMLPGMPVGCFGFPNSYAGEKAIFVRGCVSGTAERYARPPLMILQCPLNHGNSGGPVISLVDPPKIIGVVMQKHIRDILTIEEKEIILKIQESYNTQAISDLQVDEITDTFPCQTELNLLLLKLYNALSTSTQSGLSNAITESTVEEFLKDALASNYQGNDCKELSELVE